MTKYEKLTDLVSNPLRNDHLSSFGFCFFFLNKFIYLIYLFLAELGLRCGARASLVAEHGL